MSHLKEPITANHVKTKISNLRGKVFKTIANWEVSGNGDGNLVDEEAKWAPRFPSNFDYGSYNKNNFFTRTTIAVISFKITLKMFCMLG